MFMKRTIPVLGRVTAFAATLALVAALIPVFATPTCSGKVTETGTDGRWSSVVTLEDASGRLWRVCGVNSPAVKPGDTVTAGQKLGTVGTISCECAEEAHIHLEVLQNGQYLDPAKIS